ncbi:sugar kinase [Paenibacillus sp. GCM10012307]|uniref:Sugar kinase n=1 Tax=Paenibacillus roseus TaxID=2798579 RepID=A0A934MQ99_9BACL|nr:sugar kinase [Paenibacillus roseus]MBJ6361179.1 sugar kinase [Paenibacillus roseus]
MFKVAAFGEVMMRLEVPGYSTLAQGNSLDYSFSGTGVNVMSALSRFGHEAYLISTLPDNPLGEAAMAYLRKLGLHTLWIQRGGKYVGQYFLEHGFGARPSRVTYTDRLGSSFNTVAYPEEAWSRIAEGLDAVHVCGITLAMNNLARTQMKRLASEVKRRGGIIIFDCNYRPSLWGPDGYTQAKPHYIDMLQAADIVFMNEKDAMFTLGMETEECDRIAQLEHLIPQVAREFGIRTIAGTHRQINGDHTHTLTGYIYKTETETDREVGDSGFTYSMPLTFPVYDRVGAGDAYASGIIHAQLLGYESEYAVEYAAAAAMLAHTVHGDTPISSEADVVKAMSGRTRDIER